VTEGQKFTCSVNNSDTRRIEFLESLRKDLLLIGHEIEICPDQDAAIYSFILKNVRNGFSAEIGGIYKSFKQRELRAEYKFINEMEKKGVISHFINGKELKPSSIKPYLSICKSPSEHKLAKYCRLLQSVPNSVGVGRRFSALVYDIGQGDKPVLMGLICMADATISLKDRDEYLLWTERVKKKLGLRMIMQLTVCMALPPYNLLYGAKLVAALALSDPIQKEFFYRYTVPLLAVITTSATGIHNAIFNRIKLNNLIDQSVYSDYSSEMYKRIGKTSGRTLSILSDKTIDAAKILINDSLDHSSSPVNPSSGFRSSASKNRIAYEALRICGLSRKILNLNEKGLYLGSLHPRNVNLLRNPTTDDFHPITKLDVEILTTYWKYRWVSRALNDQALMDKLFLFNRDEVALGPQINIDDKNSYFTFITNSSEK